MSDFFDEKQNNAEPIADQEVSDSDIDTESTIFSAPIEHNDKKPKKSKKKLTSIIAVFLAVAVLIGGTIAVVKLIPEMAQEEAPDSMFEDIKVIETSTDAFATVTVTNKNGEFKFTKKTVSSTNTDGNEESTSYWSINDIDVKKLSSNTIDSMISAAANITATCEIDSKTPAECGLENPKIKVAVTSEKEENAPYTVLIGDESPDGLGSYMMLEGGETIYIAPESAFSSFDFALIDLADKTSIPATTFKADTSENKSDDGAYAYFDSLTISGKLYGDTITVLNNTADTESAQLVPYIITTPIKRFADANNLTSFVELFSKEISVDGCYAFDINDQTLKEFGLDDPDVVVTMTIGGEPKTFKISKVDDQYSAVVYDGALLIRKVLSANFAFLELKPEDLYYKNMFMHSIYDISALKLNDADGEIKFDISYTEDEDGNKTPKVKFNGKEITEEFKSFYSEFVQTQCSDFTTGNVSSAPDAVITFVFTDKSESVVKFYKANATQYQYSIDDVPMGKITSSAYNKIVNQIKNTAK
ncbi:MAG: DUF4340 domain-containing protein [Clostridia bacterium]|nr:DUF4340 domain-containing protein [Clostridia bacterium]